MLGLAGLAGDSGVVSKVSEDDGIAISESSAPVEVSFGSGITAVRSFFLGDAMSLLASTVLFPGAELSIVPGLTPPVALETRLV